VRVWDLAAAFLRATIQAHKGPVGAVAFLPGAETVLSAGTDLWARLWRVADGAPLARMKHSRQVWAGAAAPDGRLLATGSRDKCISFWDAKGQPVRTIAAGRAGVQRLAWAPGSDVLASAAVGGLIHLWDPATGAELAALRGHSADVQGLAFSPDGTCLISGGRDRTLRVWGLV
jgi:WD40 repeat protein